MNAQVEHVWLVAALWLGLALAAAFVSNWLRLTSAVCEILVGAVAPLVLAPIFGSSPLDPKASWVVFLAGAGSLLLTFLAGSELDASMLRATWRQALVAGFVGFAAPFAAVAAVARYLLGWSEMATWVAALALSTASVSVVYTIMLDLGLNQSRLGQALLAASYLNNFFSVVAMGAVLAPFTLRTIVFVVLSALVFVLLPFVSSRLFGRFRSRASQPDLRYLLFLLFGLGGLAVWAGGEVVLPAYVMGMVLAGLVGRNATLIQHLRVLAFGVLAPFYFVRAGAQVSIPALGAAPLLFAVLLWAKLGSKLAGVIPALRLFAYKPREAAYCSLMISTGLGLGTIAASIGLGRGIIDQTQYSHIVAAVIASAVVPTAVANAWFLPRQLAARERQAEAPLAARPSSAAAS